MFPCNFSFLLSNDAVCCHIDIRLWMYQMCLQIEKDNGNVFMLSNRVLGVKLSTEGQVFKVSYLGTFQPKSSNCRVKFYKLCEPLGLGTL